jgi:hypothetical protein
MELLPHLMLCTSLIGGVASFDDLNPAILWLVCAPILYIVIFLVLLVRYRGLGSLYTNGQESYSSSESPYSSREFVLDQYEKFAKHREKLKKITELKGHIDARERRHEYVLRNLIESKQFDHAEAYLNAMISLMRELGDTDGEITYITYLDRMRQFEAAALTDMLSIDKANNVQED